MPGPDGSFTVLLERPILIAERTRLPLLKPSGDAMEVEGMIARAPRNRALLRAALLLVRLAFDADLHEMVPANGAIVDLALPLPHRHGVPPFYYKLVSAAFFHAVELHCLPLGWINVHFSY